MNNKRDNQPKKEESIDDLLFKLLESSIILNLRMNAFDEVISECEEALEKFGRNKIEWGVYAHRIGMLLSNMAIALAGKYEVEEDKVKKDKYRFQTEKYLCESITLWKRLGDDYNLCVVRLHKADFEFNRDEDYACWFRKYKSIAKKIKNEGGKQFQLLYAEVLLQMVDRYCSADALNDCGMSYRIASKYLDDVGLIYDNYCSGDVLKNMGLIKTRQALDLTCTYSETDLRKFISRSNKLIDKYRDHAMQDAAGVNMFEYYVGDIRNNIGSAYYRLGSEYWANNKVSKAAKAYERAVEYYSQCIETYHETNEQGSDLLFKVCLNIVNVKLCLYKCKKDSKYLDDSIKLINNTICKLKKLFPDSMLIAESYCVLGSAYRLMGRVKNSIKYYSIAEKICEQNVGLGNREVSFWIYGGFVKSYRDIGNIDKAVEYLKKQRELLLSCGYELDSDEVSEIDKHLKELG